MERLFRGILDLYQAFKEVFPPALGNFFDLMLLVLFVFLYVFFVWKLYKFVSTRDFLGLTFEKYSSAKTSSLAGFLYLLEYLILSPFLIFIWFTIFTIFLIFLTGETILVSTLLIVSATVISVTRITSYYNKQLSEEVAKMLPLTLLGVAIISPDFFNIERIFSRFGEIPSFLNQIFIYLLFIFLLETILRLFKFIFSLIGVEEKVEN